MAKKQTMKKKINIKVTAGETYLILDESTALHIAETYDFLAMQEENSEYASWYRDVADTIRCQATEHLYVEDDLDYEDWV